MADITLGPTIRKVSLPACARCKHYRPGDHNCDAFPAGIPREIFLHGNPHTSPFPGDHGIRFEPRNAKASANKR